MSMKRLCAVLSAAAVMISCAADIGSTDIKPQAGDISAKAAVLWKRPRERSFGGSAKIKSSLWRAPPKL